MNNNDILMRLRYAVDLKDMEMVEIFGLGDYEIRKEDIQKMLTKQQSDHKDSDQFSESEYLEHCDNNMLNAFLNGFIAFKRGKQDSRQKEPQKHDLNERNVNNVMLKKVKIALSLTSEEILALLAEAGVDLSNSELSAVLRKEGHRNYKECGDRYARNFLKGLAIKYRS
ncbi:DUF1456 family protein [Amphibacillus cookii]|uniref:DUF1456 family protein n=1 Tax=Amphibacillus cookii TaxID=767787 RepID=UPI00195EACE7|nr:DUF1456 family protein [Amphibacillus cookii]MBM7542940.1 uncharacterized protein YehS (DUF1456 family) [Amphibacillus cookii]